MLNTAGAGQFNHHFQATQLYRQQQVVSSSPVERLLIVYDVALQACAQQRLERFGQAVGVLQDSLDLSQGQVATSLLSLYLYCGDLARQGRWGEAAHILRELRDSWETAGRET
ncbi:MAG: flagellar export chaperone FliS [Anaerolineae bacterium]